MGQQPIGRPYLWAGHFCLGMYVFRYSLIPFAWQYPDVRYVLSVLWSIPFGNTAALLYGKSPSFLGQFTLVPLLGRHFQELSENAVLSKSTKRLSIIGVVANASIACVVAPWWQLKMAWVLYALYSLWKITIRPNRDIH